MRVPVLKYLRRCSSGSASTPVATAPADPRTVLTEAHEVIVTCPGTLPSELVDLLLTGPWPRDRVRVLARTGTPASLLWQLVEAGHTVYDAVVPDEVLVLADRKYGYVVPGWVPLPDPFGRACALMWARLGAYTTVSGTVLNAQEDARLVWLGVHEALELWVSLPAPLALPSAGAQVRVLALNSWIGGSALILVHAVGVEILASVEVLASSDRPREPGS